MLYGFCVVVAGLVFLVASFHSSDGPNGEPRRGSFVAMLLAAIAIVICCIGIARAGL